VNLDGKGKSGSFIRFFLKPRQLIGLKFLNGAAFG